MSNKVIGIDLGTSTSSVAVIENGKATIVANAEGTRTTPSVVSLKDGDRKVGATANRQRVVNPKETISLIKRFMGSNYDACKNIIDKVTYKVINKNGQPRIVVDGREYSPEEISSFILTKMKQTAEDYLGETVDKAVITCPAWFDSAAREATKLAGEMCGLEVLRVINEPTAAILSSNIDTTSGDKTVLVADIGGGTTDFSVCVLSDGLVEVLASKGDVFLGGSDFDNAIADWMVASFKEENGVDISTDAQAMQRVLEAAEKAKVELSTVSASEINLPYIAIKDGVPAHLIMTLTKAKMEQLTSHLVDRIVACGVEAMKEAKVNNNDLHSVLLVGGQSRSTAIQTALQETFNAPLNKSVNPDEAVALGAAVQANIIVGGDGASDILLLDVTPLTLGIETLGGVMTPLVEANTTIPCRKSQIFSTAMDSQPSVTINVLQGERPMAKDNKSLGLFNLDGIAPAPKGVPQIEVSFDISADGILSVSAVDKATGKEQTIRIESKNSLSQEEIDRIKTEAEEHKAEDERTRKELEKMNKCEGLIYQTEKTMDSFKDKPEILTESDTSYFNEKLTELKKMQTEKDFTNLKNLEEELNKRWYEVSARAYGQNNQNTYQQFMDTFGQNNQFNGFGGFNPNSQPDTAPNDDVQDAK